MANEFEEQQESYSIPVEAVNQKLLQRVADLIQQEATASAAVDVLISRLQEAEVNLQRLTDRIEELEEKVKPRKAA